MNKKKIVFGCKGNICRSPLAEFLLRKYLINVFGEDKFNQNYEILSCGTNPSFGQWGAKAAKKMREVAKKHNLDLESHRAKPATFEMLEGAYKIYLMDNKNLAKYTKMFPNIKFELLGDECEIPDPYGKTIEDFEKTYDEIGISCEAIVLDELFTTQNEI